LRDSQQVIWPNLLVENPCENVVCQSPETCKNGVCKCGKNSSCYGLLSGSFCDSENSVCKCTKDLNSCKENANGLEYCDITAKNGTGVCKCSESIDYCLDGTDTCYNGVCQCGKASGFVCSGVTSICEEGICGMHHYIWSL